MRKVDSVFYKNTRLYFVFSSSETHFICFPKSLLSLFSQDCLNVRFAWYRMKSIRDFIQFLWLRHNFSCENLWLSSFTISDSHPNYPPFPSCKLKEKGGENNLFFMESLHFTFSTPFYITNSNKSIPFIYILQKNCKSTD